jgi:hypothetical protein
LRLAVLTAFAATGLLSGCLTLPHRNMEGLAPVQPAEGEMVVVNDLYIVVDASGSMHLPDKFRVAKDLVHQFAIAAPDDYYGVQLITFGGEWKMDWLNMSMDTFDRQRLLASTSSIKFLSGSTPLAEALDTLAPGIKGRRTHSAVLILSDGMSDPAAAMASARALLSSHPGELCFHTVHTGCDEPGAALMQEIASLTSCGTHRHADAASSVPGMESLVRDVFFGNFGDDDNDGVPNPRDLCPDSPAGATVNAYGCDSWATVYFDTDKSIVKRNFNQVLDEVAARINASPGVCLRVEGHADSRNEVGYNQGLSERRVEAVRKELEERGVNAGRLITTGSANCAPPHPIPLRTTCPSTAAWN